MKTMRHFTMLNSNISGVCFHKYRKIKINSDDDLPLEKTIKYALCSNTY